MSRLNVLLFVGLIVSGLYLVHVSYQARRLFTQVERAQAEERALETAHEQLQLEKRTQATALRVEKLAREKLQMRTPTAAVTQYVHYEGAASAAQGGAR
ncbi:MAG: cell division protein FtsL [Caldimonas sp.]|uniref:cell division protein FtsL n=1 Tax=Caldimonas sp. TaxID=2838790 RepID=UPI00391D880C